MKILSLACIMGTALVAAACSDDGAGASNDGGAGGGDESGGDGQGASGGSGAQGAQGGQGGGGGGETGGVRFVFPPQSSWTDADTIVVRGTAGESSSIASITVAGVAATSSDGFATWSASVPLTLGDNTLSVDVVDVSGNTATDVTNVSVRLESSVEPDPIRIALDQAGGRAFVSPGSFTDEHVWSVDLSTGERAVVSSRDVGSGPDFDFIRALVWDEAEARVLALHESSVVEVDPATGDRSTLTTFGSSCTGVGSAIDLELGPDPDLAFLLDEDAALWTLDLTTGACTLVATGSDDWRAFALDFAGNRAFAVEWPLDKVVEIDLETGAKTDVTSSIVGSGPFWDIGAFDGTATYDPTEDAVYVAGWDHIVAVDVATGNRTVLADRQTASGPTLERVIDLVDGPDGLVAVDPWLDAVVSIDRASGDRTFVSEFTIGDGAAGYNWQYAGINGAGTHVVTYDDTREAVVTIDRETGERVIASSADIGTGPEFRVQGFDLEVVGETAYLVRAGTGDLIEIDLVTGDRAIVSDGTTGSGPFEPFYGLGADPSGDIIYATTFAGTRVFSIDLATGDRTIVSDDATGTGPSFANARGIAVDGDRLLVPKGTELLAVDIATGDRTVLSSLTVGSGPPAFGTEITVVGSEALITNSGQIVAIDLSTGDRTSVSSLIDPIGPVEAFSGVTPAGDDLLYAVDRWMAALMVVDRPTGQRVVVSK